MNGKPHIYYFFPLSSIGGTEVVHGDVMKALQEYPSTTYVRYRGNVWKGRKYAKSKAGLAEGSAMLPEYENYSKVFFASHYLEAPRFGRWIRKSFIKKLAKKINESNAIVIFWHRESIDYLLPYLEEDVKIVDIIHNNNNDEYPDPKYLVNDWVPKLDSRIMVSSGLYRWIDPLYKETGYDNYKDRIKIIEHAVHLPSTLPDKSNSKLKVLFVGRDAIEERIHLIESIAQKCAEENLPIIFTMVGPDKRDDGPKNINWMGVVKDRNTIENLYSESDVLLITSSSEGFPKVIAEGTAYGCIPIATKVGSIPEHITHQKNGILTQSDDCVNETLHWLKELLKDAEMKKQLHENAYLYCCENFGFEDFKQNWRKVIDELC